MKSVVPNLVLTVLTALFSLPLVALLVALYIFVFFAIGGGWAISAPTDSGPNHCHFVIGPIGYLMLGLPILGVGGVIRLVFRKFRPAA